MWGGVRHGFLWEGNEKSPQIIHLASEGRRAKPALRNRDSFTPLPRLRMSLAPYRRQGPGRAQGPSPRVGKRDPALRSKTPRGSREVTLAAPRPIASSCTPGPSSPLPGSPRTPGCESAAAPGSSAPCRAWSRGRAGRDSTACASSERAQGRRKWASA